MCLFGRFGFLFCCFLGSPVVVVKEGVVVKNNATAGEDRQTEANAAFALLGKGNLGIE